MNPLRYIFIRSVMLLVLLPCSARAQQSCVQAYATLIPDQPNRIELQVDASCLTRDYVITGISYRIQFFDAGGAVLGMMEFSTPPNIRRLPNVQTFQVFQDRYPSAARAALIDLSSLPAHLEGTSPGPLPGAPRRHFANVSSRPLGAPPATEAACIPTLMVPGTEEQLPQRRLSKGKVETSWMFGWQACPGARRYHLFVIGPQALNPIVDDDSIEFATYLHRDTHFGITQLEGWTWKVRAFVDGRWGEWSQERRFRVSRPQ